MKSLIRLCLTVFLLVIIAACSEETNESENNQEAPIQEESTNSNEGLEQEETLAQDNGVEGDIQAFFNAFAEAAETEDAERFYSLQYDEFESPEQIKEWFQEAELTYEATLIEVVEESDFYITVKAHVLSQESEDGLQDSLKSEETLKLVKPGAENYGNDNEFGLKLILE